MRKNLNLPNRQISSNNVNGRQLPSTSPVYSTTGVEHLTEIVDILVTKVIEPIIIVIVDTRINHTVIKDHTATIDLIVIIDHKTDMTKKNRNRSQSNNRNNNNRNYSNNRNCSNSYHRNSNRSISNNRNNQRYNSRSPYQHSQSPYQSRSSYKRDRNPNSNNGSRYHSNDRNRGSNNQNYRQSSNNGNRNNHKSYHRQNGNRINNIEDKPHENEQDQPGIEECNYSTDSSDEDQQILEKVYNAQENTCNSINTIESNPTRILPMYQCTNFKTDFTKQKLILEISYWIPEPHSIYLTKTHGRS